MSRPSTTQTTVRLDSPSMWTAPPRAVVAGILGGAVAAGWIGVAVRGPVTVGHLVIPPLAAAAACGTALLAATLPDLGRPEGQASLALLVGAPVTVAMAAGRGSFDPLLVLTAGVAAAGLWIGPGRWLPLARVAGGFGAALLVVAHTLSGGGRMAVHGRPEAAAFLAAAVLLIGTASAPGAAPSSSLLLLTGVLAGLTAAPALPVAAAVIASAAAALAAAGRRPATALALVAVAAAAVPAGLPAGRLLAAGAVIAAAVGGDVVVVAGLPGAVVLSAVLVRSPWTSPAALAAVGALATAGLLAARMKGRVTLDPARIPAAAIGVWLLVGPGSWRWVGPTRLEAYDNGAAKAVAVALVVLLVTELMPRSEQAVPGPGPSGDPLLPAPPALAPRFARPVAWMALALLLGSVGWLVLSAVASR